MKKVILVIPIFLIALVGFWYLNQSSNPTTTSTLQVPANGSKNVDEMIVNEDAKTSSGRYIMEYSAKTLEENSDKTRVLFFYANWCPTCQPIDRELASADIPDNLVIIRVNYNDTDTDSAEKELAKSYAVTYQHTFVVLDSTGKAVTKWNGGGSLDDILSRL